MHLSFVLINVLQRMEVFLYLPPCFYECLNVMVCMKIWYSTLNPSRTKSKCEQAKKTIMINMHKNKTLKKN